MSAEYAKYTTAVTAYNTKKDDYTKAFLAERERAGDFARALVEPPIYVPVRPCPPETPLAWWGPNIDLAFGTHISAWTSAVKTTLKATLIENNYTPDAKNTYKMGFLQSTTDTTGKTETTLSYVGHVFGKLGQGEIAMPGYAG